MKQILQQPAQPFLTKLKTAGRILASVLLLASFWSASSSFAKDPKAKKAPSASSSSAKDSKAKKAPSGKPSGKCTVCHIAGKSGRTLTLEVACEAVQAHLNHGDNIGPCAPTPARNN